jgi:hypothetical protein
MCFLWIPDRPEIEAQLGILVGEIGWHRTPDPPNYWGLKVLSHSVVGWKSSILRILPVQRKQKKEEEKKNRDEEKFVSCNVNGLSIHMIDRTKSTGIGDRSTVVDYV